MNDDSECGCTTVAKTECADYDTTHVCAIVPPYHFGIHQCACSITWAQK